MPKFYGGSTTWVAADDAGVHSPIAIDIKRAQAEELSTLIAHTRTRCAILGLRWCGDLRPYRARGVNDIMVKRRMYRARHRAGP